MRVVVGAVCTGLALLSGCSEPAQQDAAAAAVSFVQADPQRGCSLLAPDTVKSLESTSGTACAAALPRLDLPTGTAVRDAEVAGESAQVQLEDQVLFLARFPEGWLVTAAGCVRDDPDPAVPYDCEVGP